MAQDDIQGQVVDGSGNPVSGAIVELTKSYQSTPVEQQRAVRTTTDSNGNYIFNGHPDSDGTTQEWHVAAYTYDGTNYVNSFNNPGVTANLSTNQDIFIKSGQVVETDDTTTNEYGTIDNGGTYKNSGTVTSINTP